MKILLARHGETPWNAEGRYQGQIDIPLSENGIRQAKLLGERLQDQEFDRQAEFFLIEVVVPDAVGHVLVTPFPLCAHNA